MKLLGYIISPNTHALLNIVNIAINKADRYSFHFMDLIPTQPQLYNPTLN